MRVVPLVCVLAGCGQETGINRILTPPEVWITIPEPQQRFRIGSDVGFEGTVLDTFDDIDTLDITWILDGELALAPTARRAAAQQVTLDLDIADLALGEHLIQLAAVDTDGMEALTGVPFLVDGALSAPVVTIDAPDAGALFAPGEEITFRGSATDNNTDPDALAFAWFSSVDGARRGAISGGGQSVLFDSDLSTGTHEIVLQAMDRDGETGEARITVSVGELGEAAKPGDLVFSEFMINPEVVDDELGEWVELYNTSGFALDIGGYTFRDDDVDRFELEGPLVVAPHDTVVLCAEMATARNGGVPCDGPFMRLTSGALALGNNTDEVILERPDGIVIDQVIYERSWFRAGVAIGLDPSRISADNNDTESDWCDQTTVITTGGEPGTPGRTNDPC